MTSSLYSFLYELDRLAKVLKVYLNILSFFLMSAINYFFFSSLTFYFNSVLITFNNLFATLTALWCLYSFHCGVRLTTLPNEAPLWVMDFLSLSTFDWTSLDLSGVWVEFFFKFGIANNYDFVSTSSSSDSTYLAKISWRVFLGECSVCSVSTLIAITPWNSILSSPGSLKGADCTKLILWGVRFVVLEDFLLSAFFST